MARDREYVRSGLFGHEAACAGKKAYPSRKQAQAHLKPLRNKEGEPFHVYLCRGGHFHVGHVIREDH